MHNREAKHTRRVLNMRGLFTRAERPFGRGHDSCSGDSVCRPLGGYRTSSATQRKLRRVTEEWLLLPAERLIHG